MNKLILILTLLCSTNLFAKTEIIEFCQSSDGSTSVRMKTISKPNFADRFFLMSLKIKGKIYLKETQVSIECQRHFESGSGSEICYLKNNIVSIFLRSYTPHSGLILYDKNGASVTDVLGLECKSDRIY